MKYILLLLFCGLAQLGMADDYKTVRICKAQSAIVENIVDDRDDGMSLADRLKKNDRLTAGTAASMKEFMLKFSYMIYRDFKNQNKY